MSVNSFRTFISAPTEFGIESSRLQKFLNIFKLASSNLNEKEAVKDKHEQVTG